MSNEYERQRLENIRKNEELLKSLNITPASKIIPTARAPTTSLSPAPKAKPASKKRKAPAAAASGADSTSTRRTSLRLRGLQPDGEQAARAALTGSTSSSPAAGRAEKRARRDTAALSLDDAMAEGSSKVKQAGHLLRELAELVQADVKEKFDANPYAYESGDDNEPEASSKAIRRLFGQLEVQHEAPVKVVSSRIYTAEFAPIESKVLACVGDKMGTLALWDLTDHVQDPRGRSAQANDVEDDDDEDTTPAEDPMLRNLFTFQPHSGTISTIHFPPGLPADRLYTSSYDGTVRALDLAAQEFATIASGADEITSMASSAALPNFLWLSTASGSAAAIDVRAGRIPVMGASVDVSSRVDLGSPFATKSFHGVCDKKCGCVSVHPTKPHLVLLSSNDTSMRLFDVRRAEFRTETNTDHAALFSQLAVPTEPSKDDEESVPAHGLTQLASYAHGYSCTAAYFRPNDGNAIVSTSYDDRVRIWRDSLTSLASPTFSAMHNNKTGKWVTTFRARWHPTVPDCVLVGNMKRHVDVMDAKTGKFVAMLDHASISAVPAVVAVHPAVRHQGVVLAGNASGKCHVWTRRVEEDEEGEEVKEEGDE
ncbi:hypothetical protein GGF31_001809 [Allomyces arbusculus]|nr:hypothetical protein GGF31_001809 [Allomyces arbusculus]